MQTDEWFAHWRRLLELERLAGRAQFEATRSEADPAARIAAGFALGGLVVQDTGAGALGRAAWLLAPKEGELGTAVSAGDPVRVYRRRTPGDAVRALATRRTRRALTLLFDEPPDESFESAELVVEREFDDTSHQRLVTGLSRLESARGSGAIWREILVGSRKPTLDQPTLVDDPRLNERQRLAASRALSAAPVALVHGPPGTGKTEVLAAIAQAELARGGTVLACAASNAAVDNLVQRLAARGLDPIRLGHPARVHPDVVGHTLDARVEAHEKAIIAAGLVRDGRDLLRRADRAAKQGRASDRYTEARESRAEAKRLFAEARHLARAAEEDVLGRARVVCATLTGLDRLGDRTFSLALIDEATQATLPASVLALLRCERAVLAGDQHQLPPTVLSPQAARDGLASTLYDRLLAASSGALSTMLDIQHRMHREIMAFPSSALYSDALVAHPAVADARLGDWPVLTLLDTAGKGWAEERPEGSESLRNPGEAARIVREVQALIASGVPSEEIGVITPYAAQVQLLRTLLPEDGLEIDTVDAFQGREKVAVLVSLVRSNDDGHLGFVADVRRLNVALTRARRRLFVIGDSATLSAHEFHAALWLHAQNTGDYLSAWEEPDDA
jgi:ATP-dependent RNA/DNA helicase IGHMBP2